MPKKVGKQAGRSTCKRYAGTRRQTGVKGRQDIEVGTDLAK